MFLCGLCMRYWVGLLMILCGSTGNVLKDAVYVLCVSVNSQSIYVFRT